ncbi:hypothetical protein CYMTET_21061, partial [Cymbomonas tetramitiformis]
MNGLFTVEGGICSQGSGDSQESKQGGEFPRPMRQMPQEYAPPMRSAPAPAPRVASRANGTNALCDTLFLRDISVTEAQVQSVAASL